MDHLKHLTTRPSPVLLAILVVAHSKNTPVFPPSGHNAPIQHKHQAANELMWWCCFNIRSNHHALTPAVQSQQQHCQHIMLLYMDIMLTLGRYHDSGNELN